MDTARALSSEIWGLKALEVLRSTQNYRISLLRHYVDLLRFWYFPYCTIIRSAAVQLWCIDNTGLC